MKKSFSRNIQLLLLFIFISIGSFILFSFLGARRIQKNVVSNKDTTAQAVVDKCKQSDNASSCYSAELSKIVNKSSLEDAIAILEKIQEKDVNTLYCHVIAHKITSAAALKDPDNWLDLFSQIDMAGCSNGYFHGILEGYLATNPDFILDKTSSEKICGQIQNVAKNKLEMERAPGNCAHAIGHVLLVEARGEIDKALPTCASLKEDFRYPCFRGVFMETIERESLVLHGISPDLVWDEKNTLVTQQLCNKYSDDAKKACVQSLAPMYATISKSDYKKLYVYCQAQTEQENRDMCYREGISYMAFLLARDTVDTSTQLPELCEPLVLDTQLYRQCIRGVASYLINASPRFVGKLHSFCAEMISSEADLCYREVTRQLSSVYGKAAVKNFCDGAQPTFQSVCMQTSR